MGAGANYPKPIAPFMQYALPLQTTIRIEFVAAGAEARFKQPRLPLKAGVGGLKPLPSLWLLRFKAKQCFATVVWQRPSRFRNFKQLLFSLALSAA